MKYSILRTHLSPYQLSGFKDLEKSRLESLGMSYLESDNQISDESDLIVITNTHTKFEALSEKIKSKAKLVIHPNSGYENFSTAPELQKIPVIVGNEVRAQAVAEYALSCFVDYWTRRPLHSEWDKERAYPRKLMNQTTALIIGQGQIGKILLTMLTALGVKVTTVDPRAKAQYKNLQEINGTFDSVILAASLNSKSLHLVNKSFLEKFNPSVLINPARGGFVKENDLIHHLNHSQMSAYLDVFEKEPLPSGTLSHPRLYKTSHIAGVHDSLDQGIIEFEYKVLKDYLTLSEKDFMVKYQEALLSNKWFQGELW